MIVITEFLKNKEGYEIYCDLDGVLCNFDKQLVTTFGQGTYDQIIAKHGVATVWKLLHSTDVKYWAEMEWMPDGPDLWNYIKKHNASILSSIGGVQSAAAGKKIWCQNHLGKDVKVMLAFRSGHKKQLASKNIILIDDMEKNIQEWNTAGGIGIWHKNAKMTIKQLKKLGL